MSNMLHDPQPICLVNARFGHSAVHTVHTSQTFFIHSFFSFFERSFFLFFSFSIFFIPPSPPPPPPPPSFFFVFFHVSLPGPPLPLSLSPDPSKKHRFSHINPNLKARFWVREEERKKEERRKKNAPTETGPLPQSHAQDLFVIRVRGKPSLRCRTSQQTTDNRIPFLQCIVYQMNHRTFLLIACVETPHSDTSTKGCKRMPSNRDYS